MSLIVRLIHRGGPLLLPSLLGLLHAGGAAAQECQADADCGPGYQCSVGAAGGCSVGPCTPDGACPPPVCETFEYRYCSTAPCASDADCPDSMACHTETSWECSAPAGCAGEGCPEFVPTEPTCTERSYSSCVERYNLPCTADADCGPGFECEEGTVASCGGGGVRPDGDGGVIVEDEWECSTQPSGYFYCKLLPMPCEADAECPDGFSCQQDFVAPTCAATRPPQDGGAPVVVECDPPPPPTYSCKPRNYNGGGGSVGSVGGGATIGGGPGGPTGPAADAGAGDPGSFGGLTGGGSVAGTLGGGAVGGGAGTVGGGSAPGGTGGGASEGEEDDEHPHHGRGRRHERLLRLLFGAGGCSVPGAAQSDLSWLAVAGLLWSVSRRRRG